MKSMVDNYQHGQMIPHCQLQAELQPTDQHQRESLRHRLHLLGAKEPYNEINICITVEGITSLRSIMIAHSLLCLFSMSDIPQAVPRHNQAGISII